MVTMLEAYREEREFVRIDTRLPLHYQRLTPTEYRREKARILTDRQARMHPFLQLMDRWSSQDEPNTRSGELERLVAPVLAAMNEKLDRILATLNPADPIALRFEEPKALNIGGAGIGLRVTECLPVDTVLALHFLLPFPFPVPINAIARVIRVEPLDLAPQQWYAATKFDVIHEEDREAIIRYIFREQRIALRTRNTPMAGGEVESPPPSADASR
jgi:hypothetical protein